MRLLKKSQKKVYVFAEETVDSGYVGTKQTYLYKRAIECNVTPADNKITSEIYGERVYSMIQLIYAKNHMVFDAVSLKDCTKPTHKIVSVKEYSDHCIALAEIMP